MTSLLFSPYECRGVRLKNRIGVAPMCQYSSVEGMPNAWHVVHLGSRAVGGAGLVMIEATAVSREGRITPSDMGIWSDGQAQAFVPVNDFIRSQGAVAGIQLAHAGRKGSTQVPWVGRRAIDAAAGGWQPLAPSPVKFSPDYPLPSEMSEDDFPQVVRQFAEAARRSVQAGFEVIELHAGHGYLLHEFLSPLTNRRSDRYGGAFENRVRLLLEVVNEVRRTVPDRLPLFVRLSATDWLAGGWDLDQSVELAVLLRRAGVDLIDCSSGSIVPESGTEPKPGYQVPLADAIRRRAGIATAAVGAITRALQGEEALRSGACDLVLLGRQLLRDPYWPLRAAEELGADVSWPVQYQRAIGSVPS